MNRTLPTLATLAFLAQPSSAQDLRQGPYGRALAARVVAMVAESKKGWTDPRRALFEPY